jgi:hypothetical protein
MTTIASKAASILQSEGPAGLSSRAFFSLYRRSLRRVLPPDGYVMYGGLRVGRERKVGDRRWFARLLPPDLRDNPTYEQALISGLRSTVRPGDKVIVVGGGEGITAAMAALLAGPSGHVQCFEGDRDGIGAVGRTAAANGVADRIDCTFAVVGSNIGVFGDDVAEEVVAPQDLPACDVLEMDCEGSEVQILKEMTIRPRAIVVETHGFNGASTALVSQILRERGYEVEDLGLAEPKPACIGRDEHVVLARRPDGDGTAPTA